MVLLYFYISPADNTKTLSALQKQVERKQKVRKLAFIREQQM